MNIESSLHFITLRLDFVSCWCKSKLIVGSHHIEAFALLQKNVVCFCSIEVVCLKVSEAHNLMCISVMFFSRKKWKNDFAEFSAGCSIHLSSFHFHAIPFFHSISFLNHPLCLSIFYKLKKVWLVADSTGVIQEATSRKAAFGHVQSFSNVFFFKILLKQ